MIAAYVCRTDSNISTTCFKRSGRRGEVDLTAYHLPGDNVKRRSLRLSDSFRISQNELCYAQGEMPEGAMLLFPLRQERKRKRVY
jgi:hypothetical protein